MAQFPEGVSGHLLQGEKHHVAFVHFDRDTEVPGHSHRAQWEIAVAGEVRLRMGGEERTIRAGYRAVIIFDQADRYQAKAELG